jgi:hypothetical protein
MVANRTRKTPSRGFVEQSFTVRQQSVGAYDDETGQYVAGADTDTGLTGSVQPAAGEVLQQLPENERVSETLSIWTNGIAATGVVIKIRSNRFGTEQTQGDKILYDGFEWSVRINFDFNAHGHQELLITKDDDQNG